MKSKGCLSPRRILLSVVVSAMCSAAQAESYGTYSITPTDNDGRVVPGFYPNVEFDIGHDDNVLRTETNKQSSTVALLKPELQWIGVIRKHLVRVGYQGEYSRYFDASSEDYKDHFLGADVTLDLTPKFNLNAGAAYRIGHENRGAAGVLNIASEPNRWKEWSTKVEALYGRRIATAQVGVSYEHRDREFTNNAQGVRDFDGNILTLVGYYNLGPKTQLLIEPSFADFSYPNSIQDNKVRKLLAGVTWTATAKTTGKFKIGRYEKDFDSVTLGDASGASLDMEVIWEPKTYSQVVIKASRDTNDSIVGGSASYESSVFSVDWNHDLTDLTQMQLGVSYENDEYDVAREDDFYDAYLGVSYSLTRDFTVGARYDYSRRDSSVPGNDYRDNLLTLGIKTTFD